MVTRLPGSGSAAPEGIWRSGRMGLMAAGNGLDARYFISYSRVDGDEFAVRLADRLVAGPPLYPVWIDVHDALPAVDWDDQIRDAIQACRGLLLVVTNDSVRDHSVTKPEWVWALKCKKPVIPLLVHNDAELPFRLSSRQYIQFSDDFEAGLARLRNYLGFVGSPEWILQELRYQLTEAERELPRADPGRRPRFMQDVQQLRQRIAGQAELVADPLAAQRRTEERIAVGLEQQRQPERPAAPPSRAKFVNPPPVVPSHFQDRYAETEQVAEFLRTDQERIMTLVGRGGVGKTTIAARLLKALEDGRLPDGLGELEVDGIVCLSPTGAHPVGFPNLFAGLCRLLPEDTADRLLRRYRAPRESPAALIRALLDAFPARRVICLLDNAEDVIDISSDGFVITDTALDEGLRALLAAPAHAVKIIMTTRVPPRGLLLANPERQRILNLDEGLSSPFAERLLRARDPDGRLGLKSAPDDLLARVRERTRGYPRALEAVAAILAADRDTTLPELLAETAQLPGNVVEALVGAAFSRLDPLAQQVMQALAIYAVPVPPVAVDYLLQPYRPAVDATPVLSRLVNMQFARREAGRYSLHQVDRDYALSRIPAGQPTDRATDPAPFSRLALRHRGGDYFEQTRIPREEWKSLDDLASQLAAFELRYQGEDYDSAARVLLGIGPNYLILWGHYRLTIELHERLRNHLKDPDTVGRSLVHLGSCYSALGRTRQAIELFEQALASDEASGDKSGQAVDLSHLGVCYHQLGLLPRAMDLHEQALAISRAIGHRQGEADDLRNLGICEAKLGRLPQAIERYHEALSIDRERGNKAGEAAGLGNLGNCYLGLGQPRRAMLLFEQALATSHEIGYRFAEAISLASLGMASGELEERVKAIRFCQQAIEVADMIGDVEAQSRSYLSLAQVQLLAGDMPAALRAALVVGEHNYILDTSRASLVAGIALLRQDQLAEAASAFRDVVRQADELLRRAGGNFAALDDRAVALCGLARIADTDQAASAARAFRAARAITRAAGTVKHTLALFDLVAAEHGDIFVSARQAAAGIDE